MISRLCTGAMQSQDKVNLMRNLEIGTQFLDSENAQRNLEIVLNTYITIFDLLNLLGNYIYNEISFYIIISPFPCMCNTCKWANKSCNIV